MNVLCAGLATLAALSPSPLPMQAHGRGELRPFRSVALPYYGPGSITVFREGVLHVTVGGAPLAGGAPLGVARTETASIRLASPRGLGLVLAHGEWRLEPRDATPGAERVLPLVEAREEAGRESGLVGLLHLEGALYAGRCGDDGTWLFELLDLESGESFGFLYRPDPTDLAGQMAREAALVADCSSGTCDAGSCSITCNPPYLCSAGCLDGVPKCACILPLPPEPLPTPRPLPRT